MRSEASGSLAHTLLTSEPPAIVLPDLEASEHVWQHTSNRATAQPNSDAERKVEELLNRVRQLEQILSDSASKTTAAAAAAAPSISASQAQIQATRDILSKGRLLGKNHLISTMQEVWASIPLAEILS